MNPGFRNKATRSIRVRVLSLSLSLSWRKLSDRQDAGLEEDCLIYGAFILAYIRLLELNGL